MPPYAVLGVPTGAIAADFAVAVQPAFEARSGISAAFLCWVRYGDDPTPALALLIVGAPDQSLREAIGAVFTRMSGPNDSMDMIFLEPAQAADLQIPAIYTRSGERP
ncbi:MAG: enhanced serine sensitivity protein SseB C-terminal domain-containing protein [Caulobacterales bacterium]|nr:enhanced serine sensitivity protein SseB C-terminal domain-containing protein [Caulobacterales bacterium]